MENLQTRQNRKPLQISALKKAAPYTLWKFSCKGMERTITLRSEDDVTGGLLYYVAQSFLLAGSIFGLDQYIRIINKHYHEHTNK